MAVVLPRIESQTASPAERKVRDVLARLPDPWWVLHSVAWQSQRNGREGDGEADFVLLHPSVGLLVLEVKGGGIRVQEGSWYSRDRFGDEHAIKDPYEQATGSKHALVEFLRDRFPALRVSAGHAVVFPDIRVSRVGPAGTTEVTWDRDRLADIDRTVQGAVEHWGLSANLRRGDVEAIASVLLPSLTVQPLLRDEVSEAEKGLQRLTDEQILVLDGLRRNRRTIVYGGAGTGKSLLAVHRAVSLAMQDFEVLLTCFNQPLAHRLAELVGGRPGITVKTFHKLCADAVRDSGESGSEEAEDRPGHDLAERLPSACAAAGASFDAVVVDEGQDFHPSWWLALQLILSDPDQGPIHVFADTFQGIYCDDWEPPFEEPAFELTVNCRNTVPIARHVMALTGSAGPTPSLGVEGPAPVFTEVGRADRLPDAVRRVVHRLTRDEKISPTDIVLLSPSKAIVAEWRHKVVGGVPVGEPGSNGMTAETVQRFKGLESPAVVLIVEPGSRVDDSLLYVGMSRARSYLEVVGEPSLADRLTLAATTTTRR